VRAKVRASYFPRFFLELLFVEVNRFLTESLFGEIIGKRTGRSDNDCSEVTDSSSSMFFRQGGELSDEGMIGLGVESSVSKFVSMESTEARSERRLRQLPFFIWRNVS
jgi:hypothetical protein